MTPCSLCRPPSPPCPGCTAAAAAAACTRRGGCASWPLRPGYSSAETARGSPRRAVRDVGAEAHHHVVTVVLLFFHDCPNWRVTDQRLREALVRIGWHDVTVEHRTMTTPEDGDDARFHGSPTVLIDGRDPFADPDDAVGLSCRVYRTEDGLAGSPNVDQLIRALRRCG